MSTQTELEEPEIRGCGLFNPTPVSDDHNFTESLFFRPPYISSLLFTNHTSIARDICASERNFLSWLRMTMFMNILSMAFLLSLHLRDQEPSNFEKAISKPLGIIFWILGAVGMVTGNSAYFVNIKSYARKRSQVRKRGLITWVAVVLAVCILVACGLLIGTHAGKSTRTP